MAQGLTYSVAHVVLRARAQVENSGGGDCEHVKARLVSYKVRVKCALQRAAGNGREKSTIPAAREKIHRGFFSRGRSHIFSFRRIEVGVVETAMARTRREFARAEVCRLRARFRGRCRLDGFTIEDLDGGDSLPILDEIEAAALAALDGSVSDFVDVVHLPLRSMADISARTSACHD